MKGKQILLFLAVGCLLALVVVALVWAAVTQKKPQPAWVMGNGNRYESVRVFKGSAYIVDGNWRDRLLSMVPEKIRKDNFNPGDSNSIAMLVRSLDARSATTGGGIPDMQIVIVDGSGVETEANGWPATFANGTLRAYAFHNFPRRSNEITVRVYEPPASGRSSPNATNRTVTEFKIPNLHVSKAPPWAPEALPATRQTNGLSITLEKLIAGMSERARSSTKPQTSQEGGPYCEAVFRITENGHDATNWAIGTIHGTAPTGERTWLNNWGGNWEKGKFVFNCVSTFWGEEPAWKVEAEAWRTSGYPSNEICVFEDLVMPAAAAQTNVSRQTNVSGVEVLLVSLDGANSGGWGTAGMPGIHIMVPGDPPGIYVSLISVQDEAGKKLVTQSGGWSGGPPRNAPNSSGNYDLHFGFKGPSEGSKIKVTLAVTRTRTVEFLVKPDLAK